MDITFTKDNKRFKYRASALIIENNHILLQNIKDYWHHREAKFKCWKILELR